MSTNVTTEGVGEEQTEEQLRERIEELETQIKTLQGTAAEAVVKSTQAARDEVDPIVDRLDGIEDRLGDIEDEQQEIKETIGGMGGYSSDPDDVTKSISEVIESGGRLSKGHIETLKDDPRPIPQKCIPTIRDQMPSEDKAILIFCVILYEDCGDWMIKNHGEIMDAVGRIGGFRKSETGDGLASLIESRWMICDSDLYVYIDDVDGPNEEYELLDQLRTDKNMYGDGDPCDLSHELEDYLDYSDDWGDLRDNYKCLINSSPIYYYNKFGSTDWKVEDEISVNEAIEHAHQEKEICLLYPFSDDIVIDVINKSKKSTSKFSIVD